MKPILFTIGNFNVYAFGFFLALSFLFSTFIIWKKAKEDLSEEESMDAYLYTSIVVLVMARMVYIIFNFDDFGLNVLKYILVRETPGLSLIGGLFGGFIYLYWYTQKHKLIFLKYLDLFSLGASLAIVFSKIGEQLGGASFGRSTRFFFGVKIAGKTGFYHPVELYEALLFTLLTVILFVTYRKVKRNIWPQGFVAYFFGLGASIIIFLLEFLKEYRLYLYGISLRQLTALIIMIAVAIPLIKKMREVRV